MVQKTKGWKYEFTWRVVKWRCGERIVPPGKGLHVDRLWMSWVGAHLQKLPNDKQRDKLVVHADWLADLLPRMQQSRKESAFIALPNEAQRKPNV